MTDREEIVELLGRYARALDQRDWEALRDCFTADAQAEYSGVVLELGVDAIVRHVSQLGRIPASSHTITNVIVTIEGDEARVESQAIVHLVFEDGLRVRGLFYSDRVVRHGGGWRIRDRRHRADWSMRVAGTPQ